MSTPKFLSIPTAYKANKIYSVVPDSGDGDLTFTRASIRTRRNSAGSIEQLATGIPALNYKAGETCPKWSFEPTRTNLLPYSDTSNFIISTIVRGSAVAKNGINGYDYTSVVVNNNMYKTTPDTTIGYKTLSVYIDISKSVKSYRLFIRTDTSSGTTVAYDFNANTLQFSQITLDAAWQNPKTKYTKVSDTIYRIELSAELLTAETNIYPIVFLNEIGSVWLGGAQLEQGDGATSLIQTSGAQGTRIADSATLGNLQTNGLLGATEGCVYLEVDADSLVRDSSTVAFRIGTTNGYLQLKAQSLDNAYLYTTIQYTDSTLDYIQLQQSKNKIIFNYNSSGVDVWVNGTKIINTSKAFSLTNQTMILSGAGRQWDLGSIAMYDTKQLDSFCQQLTTL